MNGIEKFPLSNSFHSLASAEFDREMIDLTFLLSEPLLDPPSPLLHCPPSQGSERGVQTQKVARKRVELFV